MADTKRYLIGSAAIKGLFPDFKRVPKDLDYLVETKIPSKSFHGIREEYHENPILFKYLSENEMTPDVLYTLKVSHIFWDIFWDKHMFDIVFLQEHGAKLIESLFKELYTYWNAYRGINKRSNLNMTAKDFFDNQLKKYDHDLLHTYINPNPTYFKVLKDGAEVDVDENKFHRLAFSEKVDLVREEVYIMAFERLNNRNYKVAYDWMLKKFIREHAPMWEALFIIQNYRHIHKCPINYVKIIQDKLINNQ